MKLIRLLYYYFIPMGNKLEQLLNSLIEKGWKPFGKKPVDIKEYCSWERYTRYFNFYNVRINREDTICERPRVTDNYSLRDIVSKESWLWQFVCENGMVKEEHKHERILDPTFWEWWADCKRQEHDWNYWYRLIEASLKDESELEDFLLNSIKLD